MRVSQAAGFSLVEVVVALAIMSLSLVALLHLFSSSLKIAGSASDLAIATSLARSRLAEAGIAENLRLGETSGVAYADFHWSQRVVEFGEPLAGEWQRPSGENVLVSLTVWNDKRAVAPVTLTTIRILPPGEGGLGQ
jgi:general secretion pathway protein I